MMTQHLHLVKNQKSIPVATKETQLSHFTSKIITLMRDNTLVWSLNSPSSMLRKSQKIMIITDQPMRNLATVLALLMLIFIKLLFSIKCCREDLELNAKMKSKGKFSKD